MTTQASSNGVAQTVVGATPRFEARNITVRYGGVVAVNDFSLAVADQSIVGLVGPNGAGKSTLFNAISGWRTPDTGSVFLDGREITHMRPESRARLGLARTFQAPELFSTLTVRQHLLLSYRLKNARRRLWTDVVFGRALRASDPAETEQVERTLTRLKLSAFADEQADGLPIGVTRVVEIARAVICAPRILLLDEPSAGLDHLETADLVSALCQLVKEGDMSIVLVEHDVPTVLRISDFVYVLDFGKCIAAGKPDEIANDPVVQSAYLGTAT
jgi:branched-chain amino acid transport system ATP-binding protein